MNDRWQYSTHYEWNMSLHLSCLQWAQYSRFTWQKTIAELKKLLAYAYSANILKGQGTWFMHITTMTQHCRNNTIMCNHFSWSFKEEIRAESTHLYKPILVMPGKKNKKIKPASPVSYAKQHTKELLFLLETFQYYNYCTLYRLCYFSLFEMREKNTGMAVQVNMQIECITFSCIQKCSARF